MNSGDLSMLDLFREEVRTQAATLSQGLLDLEAEPANAQRVEPLMRAAHSVKGAARIVGVEPAVQLAHAMEDAFVAAQEGRARLTPADVDVFLRATDVLAALRDVTEDTVADWAAKHERDIAELKPILAGIAAGRPTAPAPPPPRQVVVEPVEPIVVGDDYSMLDLFREEVRAQTEVLKRGLPELAAEPASSERIEPLLHAVHSIVGAARIVGVVPAAELARAMEETLTAAQDGRAHLTPDAIAALGRATDVLAGLIATDADTLAAWRAIHAADIAELKASFSRVSEKRALAPAAPAPSPSNEVAEVRERPAPPPEPTEAVVRVTAQSLNRLMSLAGESLVQARWLQPFAMSLLKLKKHEDHLAGLLGSLGQALAAGRPPEHLAGLLAEARRQAAHCRQVLGDRINEFEDHAAQAEDLNTRLYREVLVSRMRPFADGAHGFPRLVRDMARRLNKQVRLEVEGQATEVDRDILEKLESPLTHLLRNAIDHGLELPEQRRQAGKPETGVLRVEARHRAGTLAITVSDDGAGIDPERLRRKVIERGLASPDMARALSEAELLEFLFLPGFSTAPELTEFSGRGVGLDVVHTTIHSVGGSVRVTTTLGQGTTFHLQLPLTLSVLRAVLVQIGGEPYAFPHTRIDRLVRVPTSAIRSLEHRQFVTIDGQNVGLVLAAQLLELPTKLPTDAELPVLLLSDRTGQYGLLVEAFLGEQDLVVRPLDPRLGKVPNVSAAATLDDGMPVLIADVEDLVRSMDQFIQTGSLQRCTSDSKVERRRKRVLVVDDSLTVREAERQLLRHRGYEVAVAVDGMDGWNAVREGGFDLVVTDVDMPRRNGLDLLKGIRENETLKELPVIIVSYKDRDEDRRRGLELGASYYLTKSSFHDNTFLQAVTDLIGEAST